MITLVTTVDYVRCCINVSEEGHICPGYHDMYYTFASRCERVPYFPSRTEYIYQVFHNWELHGILPMAKEAHLSSSVLLRGCDIRRSSPQTLTVKDVECTGG